MALRCPQCGAELPDAQIRPEPPVNAEKPTEPEYEQLTLDLGDA